MTRRACRMPGCGVPLSAGHSAGVCVACARQHTSQYDGIDLLHDFRSVRSMNDRPARQPRLLPDDAVKLCATRPDWPDDDGDRGTVATAKRVCANCPTQTACLEVALHNREPTGIWGGKTTTERRAIILNQAVDRAWRETTGGPEPNPHAHLTCDHCARQFPNAFARASHERTCNSTHETEAPEMTEPDPRQPAHKWSAAADHEDPGIRQLHARVIEAIRVCEEAMAQWAGQAELLAEEAQLLARLAELRAALRPQAKPLKLAPPAGGGATCDVCGKVCDPRGFGAHMKAHARRGEVA